MMSNDKEYVPPTMPAPATVAELLEQRREANAGKTVARAHDVVRRVAPGLRSRALEILDEEIKKKHDAGSSILGDILSWTREKTAGKKNVLNREELREFQDLYDRLRATEMITMTPTAAQRLAGECYRFMNTLLNKYGMEVDEEGLMLTSLAQYAIAEARAWEVEQGYVMDKDEWKQMGKPNVGSLSQSVAGLTPTYQDELRNADGFLLDDKGMPIPGTKR